ncbi:MAG: ABC transporter ATP-binding protein [Pseudomonadota bacterium]
MDKPPKLHAVNLHVALGKAQVLSGLDLELAPLTVTVIVGPNGSGKSTLLRTLGRLQKARSGQVKLEGTPLAKLKTRAIAREIAVLPQGLTAPEGISVRDLIARGRMPHQHPLQQWREEDAAVIDAVLRETGLQALADRPVAALSGGQQQRVWIAMILAQQTDLLLLDEPTTFLDLPHQIDLLGFIRRLCDEAGKTIVMVLHDINLAARFADRIVALREGAIVADGTPGKVVTQPIMREVFGLECSVIKDPLHAKPYVIPN